MLRYTYIVCHVPYDITVWFHMLTFGKTELIPSSFIWTSDGIESEAALFHLCLGYYVYISLSELFAVVLFHVDSY
jgi:hypothetical protein